jgi:hypothetical protein
MNPILSGVFGAAIFALMCCAFFGVWKMWILFKSLISSFEKVGDGIQSLKATNESMLAGYHEVSEQMKKLSEELKFLHTVVVGGAPEVDESGQGPAATPLKPKAGPLPSFPSWQPFVAAAPDLAPDAEESDTEIIDTTDDELAELEKVDEIRGRGFAAGPEADPTQNPPGVEANV